MKTSIFLGLALLAVAPLRAQILRPASINGAILGGIAGAIIGNNSGSLHHNAWQGAAIGAGAGLLLGAAADNSGYYGYGYGGPDYSGPSIYRHRPAGRVVYRGGYGGYDSYGSAATDGLWLGALAGGIIGHNSGSFRHNGWRGAAWGAGVGWLLGSIADTNAYYSYPRNVVVGETPVVQAQPQPAAAPQQITIINNYYGNATPMSAANGLFGR
jgi:hypothetical protein